MGNLVVIVPAVGGIFFPLSGRLGRPPRENVTPRVLEKIVWAGSNLTSYQNGSAALRELAGIKVSAKQVYRITSQIGEDRVQERQLQVASFRAKTLAERTAAAPTAEIPVVGVVMMDGGRHQRRDHFRGRDVDPPQEGKDSGQETEADRKTHWKENKVGVVLSMQSEVSGEDPSPEFPEWLAGAKVVCEIASLAEQMEREELSETPPRAVRSVGGLYDEELSEDHDARSWSSAPQLVSREVIASTAAAESFGWHLEYKAWQEGVSAAPRQAFVADGASVNWTIHRKHFSQMIGVLDLMHALSYAYRAATAVKDPQAYRRYACWIWQGEVRLVIQELERHQKQQGVPPPDASATDPRQRIHRALTYYRHHAKRMNYPEYRRLGLPLTSSIMESTIKQVSLRVKGTEKFWDHSHAEAILQLRADSLSDSAPLETFWTRWRANLTGANTYRTRTLVS